MTAHRSTLAASLAQEAPRPVRDASLLLESVTKAYSRDGGDPRHVVLDGIDLEVGGGEALGIIGGNGVGKSTLLKLIAGVTAPSAGRIRRPERTTAVIELGAGVHPDLTGRENAELLARLQGANSKTLRRVIGEVIEFSELGEAFEHPTRTYSTGMVARLAFSVAALLPSELLLLDEVMSVGDLAFQARCREQLERLRRGGTTLVLVSHDMDLVTTVCDRAILLRSGRVELDGPAEVVVRDHLGLATGLSSTGVSGPGLRCLTPRLLTGEPIEIHIDPLADGPGCVRLDLVISNHPTFEALGLSESVVFATSFLEVGPHGLHRRFDTTALPPARYELRATTVHEHVLGHTTTVPVVLAGARPSRFAVQLAASWTVQRVDGGEPAG